MRTIPIVSFDFPFDGCDENEDFVFNVRFDGLVMPLVNGKRVESKLDICRCAIHLLRQFGYNVHTNDKFGCVGKPTPPLYLHRDSLGFSDLTYSLFVVCSFVDCLPVAFDWSKVLFTGEKFIDNEEFETYCIVSICTDMKGKRHIHASSVCLIDMVAPVIREYLSYNIPSSYIQITH